MATRDRVAVLVLLVVVGHVSTVEGVGDEEKNVTLQERVDEMLQELRNQNQAIFKHAAHSRILSGKVSEMTNDLQALIEENSQLKQKVKLAEFKVAKKMKRIKLKLVDLDIRMDLCKCPKTTIGDITRHSMRQKAMEESKVMMTVNKTRKKNKNKKKKNKARNRKHNRQHKMKSSDDFEPKNRKSVSFKKHENSINSYSTREHFVINEDDNSWNSLGYNQIFITSGSSNSSEVLDVSVGYDACNRYADYPIQVQGSFGTFIDGRPLVCGGRSSIEDYFNSCFYYNINNDSWSSSTPMLERRFQATAVLLSSSQWWITGGFSGDHVVNSTEIYEPGIGFREGPSLPEVTFQHCLLKVNATHLFSVGGFPYNKKDS